MKILKNAKIAAAVLLCAMLAAGQAAFALEGQPQTASWTAQSLGGVQTAYLEGAVEDFAVDDQGRTVWLVRRTGDDAAAPLVHVAVSKDTKMESEGNVANGDVIAVTYRGQEGAASVVADSVKKQQPLPQVVVSGEVMELTGSDGTYNGFLLREFSDDPATAQQIIFHWDPKGKDTKMMVEGVRVGDRLTVSYNGILARSLPPQGFAQIISAADAPAAMPAAQ